MDHSHGNPWALVLAGGDGTRLQTLTRRIAGTPIPKQYCRILGRRSLLENTLGRLSGVVEPSRTLAVIHRGHVELAAPQLSAIPEANVLVQPGNRDTGPAIVLALLEVARRDPDALVVLTPSDHDVRDESAFRRAVTAMTGVVGRHPRRIALLGVRPEFADTGLGYLATGARLPRESGPVFRVRAFHEKPTPDHASALLRRGALWNSFVMAGRVSRFLALLEAVVPGPFECLRDVEPGSAALDDVYAGMEPWNFSRAFLERIPRELAVVRGDDLGWSDWGTPEAVERTFASLGIVPPWCAARSA